MTETTTTTTVTEWGVRYQYRDSDHVERYGTDQDAAARQAESYATITVRPLQRVTLVCRQVTTTAWEEVTGVKFTEDCPQCHQSSTVLLSLGHCGHCSYVKPQEEVTGVSEPEEAEAIAAEQDADAEAGQDDQAEAAGDG